jgi:hypothetical protein
MKTLYHSHATSKPVKRFVVNINNPGKVNITCKVIYSSNLPKTIEAVYGKETKFTQVK